MNKTQTSGLKNIVKGGVKEAAAKATGNKSGAAEGKVQKALGKIQARVGTEVEKSRRKIRNAV